MYPMARWDRRAPPRSSSSPSERLPIGARAKHPHARTYTALGWDLHARSHRQSVESSSLLFLRSSGFPFLAGLVHSRNHTAGSRTANGLHEGCMTGSRLADESRSKRPSNRLFRGEGSEEPEASRELDQEATNMKAVNGSKAAAGRHVIERRLRELAVSLLHEDLKVEAMPDEADQTRSAADREVVIERAHRSSRERAEMQAALDRMRDGSYGICEACEQPIPPRRLEAIPWARYCVS